MFDSLKNSARSLGWKALNTMLSSDKVLGLVNRSIERYARITSLARTDDGFKATMQLNGLSEPLAITLKEIVIDEDGNAVTLKGLFSNQEWVNNLLEDFVEGKPIDISEDYRSIATLVRGVLTRKKGEDKNES